MIKYLIAYDGYLKFDLTDIRTKAMTVWLSVCVTAVVEKIL